MGVAVRLSLILSIAVALCFSQTTSAQSLRKPRHDDSLPVKEYVAIGVPDPQAVWTNEDYEKAAEALEKYGNSNPEKLPRSGSLRSGILFARIVAPENFADFTNKKTDVSVRAGLIRSESALVKIINLYISAYNRTHANYEREHVALSAAVTMAEGQTARFLMDFLSTAGRSDPQRMNFQNSMWSIRNELHQNTSTMIKIIGDPTWYNLESRTVATNALVDHLDPMLTVLDESQRKDLARLLKDVADAETDEGLKGKLQDLVKLANKERPPLPTEPPRSPSNPSDDKPNGTLIPFKGTTGKGK